MIKIGPTKFVFALIIISLVSCAPSEVGKPSSAAAILSRSQTCLENGTAAGLESGVKSGVSFQDKTADIVTNAQRLIEINQREGAVLDQRSYGLKYFEKHRERIFKSTKVIFFGGLEDDVRKQVAGRYLSMDPAEENQDSGNIRLYTGKRKDGTYDFIIVGQNGKEVALKTVIRLLYLSRFVDDKMREKYRGKLDEFRNSLQVFLSSLNPREEFIAFFRKHCIDSPGVVMIGFRGDIRPLLEEQGISDPESYTDESLRVNWYPNAVGRKLLLVSIDQDRIFASRSGALVEALLAISATPPAIIFFGSAGAIDARELLGKIVAPVTVRNAEAFTRDGVLVHIIRNRGVDYALAKTNHVSVASVVVETTAWAKKMKEQRVDTVDQELFHIVNAINSSPESMKITFFAGQIVTDNVLSSTNATDTLESAQETISATAESRRAFFSKVLKVLGILNNQTDRSHIGVKP
jgi:hypothetical protein